MKTLKPAYMKPESRLSWGRDCTEQTYAGSDRFGQETQNFKDGEIPPNVRSAPSLPDHTGYPRTETSSQCTRQPHEQNRRCQLISLLSIGPF